MGSVAVNNTARDHVANARTVPTVDANSVNPRQNLNKYSRNNTGESNVSNNRIRSWFHRRLVDQ